MISKATGSSYTRDHLNFRDEEPKACVTRQRAGPPSSKLCLYPQCSFPSPVQVHQSNFFSFFADPPLLHFVFIHLCRPHHLHRLLHPILLQGPLPTRCISPDTGWPYAIDFGLARRTVLRCPHYSLRISFIPTNSVPASQTVPR